MNHTYRNFLSFLIICTLLLLTSCGKEQPALKVIATPAPHSEMLEYIKPDLEAQGIHLNIITVDDYQIPNRALADKDADANFFQHTQFLESQIAQFGYPLEIAANIHSEPLGAYSRKMFRISSLPDNATIAIPNDPSNMARVLLLLQEQNLITLKKDAPINVFNIIENPKHLDITEVDAAMLARSLDDVDLAFIPTNFALQAHLSPIKDALLLEKPNPLYVNVLVVNKGDSNREDIQLLIKALKSEKMKAFVKEKYKGAVVIVEE